MPYIKFQYILITNRTIHPGKSEQCAICSMQNYVYQLNSYLDRLKFDEDMAKTRYIEYRVSDCDVNTRYIMYLVLVISS